MILGIVVGYTALKPEPEILVDYSSTEIVGFEYESSPEYSSGLYGQDFYDLAYDDVGAVDHVDSLSAISAHHLLVGNKMAEMFEAVGSDEIETVVIMSPNHFDSGRSAAQISYGSWETPYGLLENDRGHVTRLLEAIKFLRLEEITFENEHGVSGLTPFIKHSFPNAKIVPLVLHEDLTREECEKIAQSIVELMPDAFVLASIDMSHYLPEYVSSFHDDVTLRTIAQGGCTDCELEIDSNASMQVLWAVNEARETQVWNKLYRGSSVKMGAAKDYEDNTSHIIGYFTEGEPVKSDLVSMTFVGDIMLSRYVGDLIESNSPYYPWNKIQAFLKGSDFVVGNFEGQICTGMHDPNDAEPPYQFSSTREAVQAMADYIDIVSLSNNHSMDFGSACFTQTKTTLDEIGVDRFGGYHDSDSILRIESNGVEFSLIGYNQFGADFNDLLELIEIESNDRFVIVYPHWGSEYLSPDSNQQDMAEQMVSAGAGLIIGSHPHVIQGSELISGTEVFYSLGNFIFDQALPGTNQGLAVGVIIEDGEVFTYPMPFNIDMSVPNPMNDSEAEGIIRSL